MPMIQRNITRLAVVLLPLAAAGAAQAMACEARSASRQTPVVELYTSEGCSSCPPADRWLSSLKASAAGQPAVLAAAFHVSYWDRLGWPDRFAHADFTARQAELMAPSGSRHVYTPQVLVNGRDWRGWPTLPVAGDAAARASIVLQRRSDTLVSVSVRPGPGAPAQLALWWALLEDGHRSAVSAGENRGAQLAHDHVVRRYGKLAAWSASASAPQVHQLMAEAKGEGGRQARLLVVVTDAGSGMPLQAAQLACGSGAG